MRLLQTHWPVRFAQERRLTAAYALTSGVRTSPMSRVLNLVVEPVAAPLKLRTLPAYGVCVRTVRSKRRWSFVDVAYGIGEFEMFVTRVVLVAIVYRFAF